MRELLLKLPERFFDLLEQRARAQDARPEDFALDLLVDHLLTETGKGPIEPASAPEAEPVSAPHSLTDSWSGHSRKEGPAVKRFSVEAHFPHCSAYSKEWAQAFVDEALQYSETSAFKNADGIGFEPAFVFIERIYTREDGFIASFYGRPAEFQRHSIAVKTGRSPTYSRISVKSRSDLEQSLLALRLAHQWKRGS